MPRGWKGLVPHQWKGLAFPEWNQKCEAGLNNHTTTHTTKNLHKVHPHCRHPALVQNYTKTMQLCRAFWPLVCERSGWAIVNLGDLKSISLHHSDSLSHEFRTCCMLDTRKDNFLRFFRRLKNLSDLNSEKSKLKSQNCFVFILFKVYGVQLFGVDFY